MLIICPGLVINPGPHFVEENCAKPMGCRAAIRPEHCVTSDETVPVRHPFALANQGIYC